MLLVRPMAPEDYPAVFDLWTATPGIGLDESDQREPTLRFLQRNPGLSLVGADYQHRIVAAVLCGHDGRRGYLSHMAVAESARGQGLATRLVRRCLDSLAAAGIQKVNVRVFAQNDAAAAFWGRLGFQPRADLAVLQRRIG